jgi:hypothetical protein
MESKLQITYDLGLKDETAVCLKVGKEVLIINEPFASKLAGELQQAQKMRKKLTKIITEKLIYNEFKITSTKPEFFGKQDEALHFLSNEIAQAIINEVL